MIEQVYQPSPPRVAISGRYTKEGREELERKSERRNEVLMETKRGNENRGGGG